MSADDQNAIPRRPGWQTGGGADRGAQLRIDTPQDEAGRSRSELCLAVSVLTTDAAQRVATDVKSPRKPAWPVVSTHPQRGLPGLQTAFTPVEQTFKLAVQTLALWAAHVLVSFLPCFRFLPEQMPEHQVVLSPRHRWPALRQPNALSFAFFAFFWPIFTLVGSAPRVTKFPRASTARREPAVL